MRNGRFIMWLSSAHLRGAHRVTVTDLGGCQSDSGEGPIDRWLEPRAVSGGLTSNRVEVYSSRILLDSAFDPNSIQTGHILVPLSIPRLKYRPHSHQDFRYR